jgi:hypothetical protein
LPDQGRAMTAFASVILRNTDSAKTPNWRFY